MKKENLKVLGIALVLILGIANLAAAGGNKDAAAGSGGTTIYYIGKAADSSYWVTVNQGAIDAAKALGVNLVSLNPNTEAEVDKQISMVETAVNSKAAAIVLAPLNNQSLIRPARDARSANVPLVLVDSMIDSKDYDKAYKTDNYGGGQQMADILAKMLGEKGTVFIIGAVAGSEAVMTREQGFIAQMKKHPNVRIINENAIQYSNNDPITAANLAVDAMAANPDLGAFFASNIFAVKGAGQGVKEAGKIGKVLVGGFDSDDDLIPLLSEGAVTATVLQSPYKMGYMGVEGAVQLIQGKTQKDQEVVDTGSIIATKENMNTKEIQDLFYPGGK
ncbi:ABC transporter substrate-binding protein [Spirochaetia bacterium]|nr:ABC transporter substrate-binding protein [Spirochaetia bacterium]